MGKNSSQKKAAAAAEKEKQRKAEAAAQNSRATSGAATPVSEDPSDDVSLQDLKTLPKIPEEKASVLTTTVATGGKSQNGIKDNKSTTKQNGTPPSKTEQPATVTSGESSATVQESAIVQNGGTSTTEESVIPPNGETPIIVDEPAIAPTGNHSTTVGEPATAQNVKSPTTTEKPPKEKETPIVVQQVSAPVEPVMHTTAAAIDTPSETTHTPNGHTPAAAAEFPSAAVINSPPETTTIPNGHTPAPAAAGVPPVTTHSPRPSATQPPNVIYPTLVSSPDVTKELPNISVNTDVTRKLPAKSWPMTSISPAQDIADHALKLKSVLAQVGAIYDMVGRQAKQMAAISPAVLGTDELNKISDKIAASEEDRRQKLDKIKKAVEDAKARLLKRGDQEIGSMIKKLVADQVKIRVKAQIETRMQALKSQLQGKEQVLEQQTALVNVEARVNNSLIRAKWPREPLRPILLSNFKLPEPHKFPHDFGQLVKLHPTDIRGLMKWYQIQESEIKVEQDGHFENLNRLMSHLGVRYRINPGVPTPILTSV